MPAPKRKYALVLPAGGARAAYQVGVLKYVARAFPEFLPTIFCGISAGAINTTFLAQGQPFAQGVEQLHSLWMNIRFEQVLETNFRSLFGLGWRWFYDLFVSKVSNRHLMTSLLDARPLAQTLLENIHFWKIGRSLRSGTIEGVSVTATNYHLGSATVFFDSHRPIEAWIREQRHAIRTSLRVRHVMASCSIPLLFEPIRVGDSLFGDGSLRFNYPYSPALHLGATHILSVGIRSFTHPNRAPGKPKRAGIGFVAGAVLNSLFLDSLEVDYENVQRINRLVHRHAGAGAAAGRSRSAAAAAPKRGVQIALVRPSHDLGAMAREHVKEVPFHFRQILSSTANPEELGDLLSYLMFSPKYVGELIALGEKDAESQHDEIARALQLDRPAGRTPVRKAG
jgi:NTE family protein